MFVVSDISTKCFIANFQLSIYIVRGANTANKFYFKGTHPVACFFIKFTKRGGSFSFIKIHDGNFVYSGGLWQHEIGIEKVF